jgi:hypothetical protein
MKSGLHDHAHENALDYADEQADQQLIELNAQWVKGSAVRSSMAPTAPSR